MIEAEEEEVEFEGDEDDFDPVSRAERVFDAMAKADKRSQSQSQGHEGDLLKEDFIQLEYERALREEIWIRMKLKNKKEMSDDNEDKLDMFRVGMRCGIKVGDGQVRPGFIVTVKEWKNKCVVRLDEEDQELEVENEEIVRIKEEKGKERNKRRKRRRKK